MSNPIQRALEASALRRENAILQAQVTTLESIITDLQAANATGQAALAECKRIMEAYADADVTLQTPDGQSVTRRLGDCLTTTLTVPAERRN